LSVESLLPDAIARFNIMKVFTPRYRAVVHALNSSCIDNAGVTRTFRS
jgi:hypothetical protein